MKRHKPPQKHNPAAAGWLFNLEGLKCNDGVVRWVGEVSNSKTHESYSAGAYDSREEATSRVLDWLMKSHGIDLRESSKQISVDPTRAGTWQPRKGSNW